MVQKETRKMPKNTKKYKTVQKDTKGVKRNRTVLLLNFFGMNSAI